MVYADYGSKDAGWLVALLLGGSHTAAHVFALLGIAGLVGLALHDVWCILVVAIAWVASGVVETMVLAAYLMVADLFGFHETDLFSAMRIEDYKCHLRIHVTQSELHVHAIGFDKVPDLENSVDAPITARQIDCFTVQTKKAQAARRDDEG